jgi:type IV pilus assembly protein PilA
MRRSDCRIFSSLPAVWDRDCRLQSGGPRVAHHCCRAFPERPNYGWQSCCERVLGVCSIVLSIFAGIPAIVLGHMSRSSIRRSRGQRKGGEMAMAGLVMGYISLALLPIMMAIFAIAIPNLFRATIASNEASALNTLRSINFAAASYQVEHAEYPASLQELSAASLFPLDSEVAALGIHNGYVFTFKRTPTANGYVIHADPLSMVSGQRHFYSDATGTIRYQREGPADARSQTAGEEP